MSRDRTKPYAEDSTKGQSMINPLNYKGDVLVQVWVDSRVLATLCRWLDKNDCHSRFMSQVVRRPLEVVADMLVSNREVEMVDSTTEARDMLERRFGVDLNRGGRGSKNVMHNLALDDRRDELGERVAKASRFNDVSKPKRGYSPLAQKAIDKYEELYGENRTDSSNKVIVKEKMTDEEYEAKSKEMKRENEERIRLENEFLDSQIEKKEK